MTMLSLDPGNKPTQNTPDAPTPRHSGLVPGSHAQPHRPTARHCGLAPESTARDSGRTTKSTLRDTQSPPGLAPEPTASTPTGDRPIAPPTPTSTARHSGLVPESTARDSGRVTKSAPRDTMPHASIDHSIEPVHHHHVHARDSRHIGGHHLLQVEDLSISFMMYDPTEPRFFRARRKPVPVIHNLHISVHAGELVAIVGASGSGKTLLADAIMGMFSPNATVCGRIWFDGVEQDGATLAALHGNGISLMPQSVTHLDPLMKVGRQILGHSRTTKDDKTAKDKATGDSPTAPPTPTSSARHSGLAPEPTASTPTGDRPIAPPTPASATRHCGLVPESIARGSGRTTKSAPRDTQPPSERLAQLLKRYNLPPNVVNKYPHELSGGMARRVLLCCALMDNPRVIIADEPTPGLDLELAQRALDDLREFADSGGGVLLITHDIELALRVADRVAVFNEGTVVEETAVANFASPSTLEHPFSRALWHALPEHDFCAPEEQGSC